MRIGYRPLERIAEAELELAFGGVGIALCVDAPKGTTGGARVGVIEVWMVGKVESLGAEEQARDFRGRG